MPNERKEFELRVHEIMKTKFPDVDYKLVFSEDVFNDQLKSETNLMTILGIITAVCILVAVFGVYSIVTLACAQRRKEIALRKIHGATLADILSIFIKEYGLIVLAASAVAFPIGYMIMKEWVAQYVKQAPIAWWIYAVILLAIVLLIALSVGSRVWRTARENPAEVIKSGN
jgi:ABC-type antimicrobial peptide transport system permease subunit